MEITLGNNSIRTKIKTDVEDKSSENKEPIASLLFKPEPELSERDKILLAISGKSAEKQKPGYFLRLLWVI